MVDKSLHVRTYSRERSAKSAFSAPPEGRRDGEAGKLAFLRGIPHLVQVLPPGLLFRAEGQPQVAEVALERQIVLAQGREGERVAVVGAGQNA